MAVLASGVVTWLQVLCMVIKGCDDIPAGRTILRNPNELLVRMVSICDICGLKETSIHEINAHKLKRNVRVYHTRLVEYAERLIAREALAGRAMTLERAIELAKEVIVLQD